MSKEAEKYFGEVSGSWDVIRKSFYGDEVRDAVLAAAKLLPSDAVLDVGVQVLDFLLRAPPRLLEKSLLSISRRQ